MLVRLQSDPSTGRHPGRSIPPTDAASADRCARLGANTKILIVEDELFVALDIEQTIEDFGCESVGIAKDAADALELAIAKRPGVILMDINLGRGRNGVDAAQDILKHLSCRIIFITAYRDAANLDRVRTAVPDALVLNKPVSAASLRAALTSAPPRSG